MDFKALINIEKLPVHVAVIMDGNGRWAQQRGNQRIFGHKNAVQAVRDTVEAAAEIGVKYLTLYAFSTENWNRPKQEVDALMTLLTGAIKKESEKLMKNQVRLLVIGNLQQLPLSVQKSLSDLIEKSKNNTGLTVILALSYSSKWEITEAVKKISKDCLENKLNPDQIQESTISEYLTTSLIPDPELMIRTSGEYRISNFLLWQLAYSELFFTSTLWPDFRKENFYEALYSFQQRERRFGKTSEQLKV